MKLFEVLEQQLKKEPNFVTDDGELKKWVVLNKAQNFDEELIGLLLDNAELKDNFFVKVKDTLIFNQNLFSQFLEQKNYLNDSYTQYKNKVGLNIDGKYLKQRNEVALVWPFKDCILEGGQSREEQSRDEIFFNEVLAQDEITQLREPKVLTNAKIFDQEGEQEFTEFGRNTELNKKRGLPEDTITDNLVMKGNNLMALHSLKKEFAGKVNLIYIDPPYNTGNDGFGYNDNFNRSSWLTFMKNRLQTARELLAKDGSIYIQLDHNEVHYFKVLMDEIFGENNFQREIIWHLGTSSGFKTVVENWVRDHDSILYYSKTNNPKFHKLYKDYDDEYKDRFKKTDKVGRKYRDDRSNGKRQYLDELKGIRISDVWNDIMSFQQASTSSEYLKFSGQKPEKLVGRVIKASTDKNDIVLDFFLGTGTTAASALKLDRQFIGIEQLSYSDKHNPIERLIKVIEGDKGSLSEEVNWQGGGSFTYLELKKYNQIFIEQIEDADDSEELFTIWEDMKDKSFLNYNVDIKKQDEHMDEFEVLSLAEQKQHLCEILDKNQTYVNLSSLNDKDFECTDEEKAITKDFYQIKD
jgi:adenine-specific DNA-methyltransferase